MLHLRYFHFSLFFLTPQRAYKSPTNPIREKYMQVKILFLMLAEKNTQSFTYEENTPKKYPAFLF
jgi:hypothetical protein